MKLKKGNVYYYEVTKPKKQKVPVLLLYDSHNSTTTCFDLVYDVERKLDSKQLEQICNIDMVLQQKANLIMRLYE